MRRPWPTRGCRAKNKYQQQMHNFIYYIDMFRRNFHSQGDYTNVVKTYSNKMGLNYHEYQMCRFYFKFTVFKMLL
jgi:hypothetical protein